MIWALAKGVFASIPRQVWIAAACALAIWWAYDWAYDRGAASRDTEVAELQAQVAELSKRVVAATEANATNQDTITNLAAANDAWAQIAQSNEAERIAAVARLDKERARLQGELQAERERLKREYQGDTYAQSWAAAAVPAGVYRVLIEPRPAGPD